MYFQNLSHYNIGLKNKNLKRGYLYISEIEFYSNLIKVRIKFYKDVIKIHALSLQSQHITLSYHIFKNNHYNTQ